MFIQTEMMQDPARMKFLPGCEVLAEGTLDLREKAEAGQSPLAEKLFSISGILGVSFGRDSIIITKADSDWQHLKPAILGVIMEHFLSGAPVLRPQTAAGGRTSFAHSKDESSIVDRIREALRQVIDPELGYNIVDLGLIYNIAVEEGGGARITMTTTTPGCPATNYLKQGAGEAAKNVPEVEFADVELSYEPLWEPEMMSPEAKTHFGMT